MERTFDSRAAEILEKRIAWNCACRILCQEMDPDRFEEEFGAAYEEPEIWEARLDEANALALALLVRPEPTIKAGMKSGQAMAHAVLTSGPNDEWQSLMSGNE